MPSPSLSNPAPNRRLGRRSLGALIAILAAAAVATEAAARARGPKRQVVSEIIVHATGGPFCRGGQVVFSPAGTVAAMRRFFEASNQVSIHYIIGPDGEVARSVPEDEVAIHTVGRNDASVGIELINAGDGRAPYPPAQIEALVKVVRSVQQRWRVPLAAVVGHEDLDVSTFSCGGRLVRRKQDPGPLFPWERLRRELLAGAAPARSGRD